MVAIRPGGPGDLDQLSLLRSRMFATFCETDAPALAEADREFFLPALSRGEAAFWLAETSEGQAVACGAVSLYRLPPKPFSLGVVYAYLSSMWTEPEFRRQGLGRQILERAVVFARHQGASYLTLHSTDAGRTLYTGFGFGPTPELRLKLPPLSGFA